MRRKREERRLVWLVIGTLLILGSVLIGLIWGWEAAAAAVPCLFGGGVLILLPYGVLLVLEKIRERID